MVILFGLGSNHEVSFFIFINPYKTFTVIYIAAIGTSESDKEEKYHLEVFRGSR